MKIFVKSIAILLSLILFPLGLKAQFNTNGEDPGRLKWSSVESPHYKIIYPNGMDSLARVYGLQLEKYHGPVSWTSKFTPGQGYRRKTPVILHAYNGVSNAAVTWAPKRMDFYTLPDAYDPDAMAWEKSLAVHESRHVSQMQLGYKGLFKPLSWIAGDIFPGVVAGLYPGQTLMEGDAVVAETALTNTGRGRSGDFLNYYMSAFDSGDWRSWRKWKYGSWRKYAPNHYALGYLTLAGVRTFYDETQFMDKYYSRIIHNPFSVGNLRKEVSSAAGKSFKSAFAEILNSYHGIWAQAAQDRAPFVKSELLLKAPSWFESYYGAIPVNGNLLVLRSGFLRPTELLEISPSNDVKKLRQFSDRTSRLSYDAASDRIYWSETVDHPRWTLGASSRIRYMSASDIKAHNLTLKGRFYNPVPSPDGKKVAAVEYAYSGGTQLVFLDSDTGAVLDRIQAPEGIQLVELAWTGPQALALSGVMDEGMCLLTFNGKFSELLPCVPAKINSLSPAGNDVLFTSDRTGVNEIYRVDALSGNCFQLTSTRYGAKDAVFKGDSLYYTTLVTGLPAGKGTGEGRLLYRTATSDLLQRKVDFTQVYRDPVAEKLSQQEKAIGGEVGDVQTYFSTPKRYRKLPHIPRFHSWAPLRVRYNDISAIDMDVVSDLAGIGATAFFQNDLGTAYGSISYGYNLNDNQGYHNSGHLQFTYAGLFPVFELEANVGDRAKVSYVRKRVTDGGNSLERVYYSFIDKPSFNASLTAYVPLRFNSGGIIRGLTPRLRYRFSTDTYDKSLGVFNIGQSLSGSSHLSFDGLQSAKMVRMQTLEASIAGYIMQAVPSALEYPKWGIGAQLGYRTRLALSKIYTAGEYAYLYGYIPAFSRLHGVRLSAIYQHLLGASFGETSVTVNPRGFDSDDFDRYLDYTSRNQLRLTADYAIPFRMEFGMKHVFQATHAVVKPHFDLTFFSKDYDGEKSLAAGMVYSAGAEFSLKLVHLFCLPFDTEVGFRTGVNGGPSFKEYGRDHRGYFSLLFNINI